MKKLYIIFTFSCCLSILSNIDLQAQDAFFSQAFNAPLSLNPASAGTGEMDLRFTANFKRHWVNIPSGMQFAAVGVDRYMKNLHGGAGLLLTNSKEGYLNKTSIHGMYSYALCLPSARLHLGLQAGVANRSVNYNKLYFSDQIDNTGIIPGAVSGADRPINNNKYFADFAAGFILYYRDNWMFGGGAHHINQPDESLTSTMYSPLPRRWFGYARYKMDIDEEGESYFLPSVIYYQQAKSNSFSFGCEYKNDRIAIGGWYRSNVNFQNSDAFAITLSLDLFDRRENDSDRMRVGMSYDATTGKLGFTRSAGSGEGAFIWEKLTPNGIRSDERCDADYRMVGTPCPSRF
ncbi:MAG: PorP/SprF family type IX secretion system membrane protein [Ferruginibacter sp.]